MEQNPLADMIEQIKYQKLEKSIQDIQGELDLLRGKCMENKLIEVEIFQNITGKDYTVKANISTEYITYIEEKGEHCYIHLSTGSMLYAVPTREEIVKLMANDSDKSYIG